MVVPLQGVRAGARLPIPVVGGMSIAGDVEFVLLALVWRFLASGCGYGGVQRVLGELGAPFQLLPGRGTVTSLAWGARFGRPFDFGSTEVEFFHARCQMSRLVRFDLFPGGLAVPLTIGRGCSYGRCTFC